MWICVISSVKRKKEKKLFDHYYYLRVFQVHVVPSVKGGNKKRQIVEIPLASGNIFNAPARASVWQKSEPGGMQIAHRDECTETGAGATRSSGGVGQGDGLCKCGHLVGNQFSALPFIYGPAFAIYTRPPVEKPLQFLALRPSKKERGKKERKN